VLPDVYRGSHRFAPLFTMINRLGETEKPWHSVGKCFSRDIADDIIMGQV
jgi:hypothetical protein